MDLLIIRIAGREVPYQGGEGNTPPSVSTAPAVPADLPLCQTQHAARLMDESGCFIAENVKSLQRHPGRIIDPFLPSGEQTRIEKIRRRSKDHIDEHPVGTDLITVPGGNHHVLVITGLDPEHTVSHFNDFGSIRIVSPKGHLGHRRATDAV